MFLNKKMSWFGKQLNDNISALENGDIGRIPWIFCVFSKKHILSKLKAAQALCKILEHCTFNDVIKIDAQMRQTTSMEWNINWQKLKLASFFTKEMNPEERKVIAVFASFNPNGFIREQAVQYMGSYEGTLPYIILRQNDWVLQVRKAALDAFDKRIRKPAPNELLDALPFAEKLGRCKNTGSIQKIFDQLNHPTYQEALHCGLHSSNIRTRRLCIYAMLGADQPDIKQILKQLKIEYDPSLRKIIFQKLIQFDETINIAIDIFLSDKSPANRVLALQYLHTHNPDREKNLSSATPFLLDKNAMVRDKARKIISNYLPDFNFLAFYRDNLENNTIPAILGLGETGIESDTIKIESYIQDNHPSVVCATMTSLMRLDHKKYSSVIAHMLASPNHSIIKNAYLLIRKYPVTEYETVAAIFYSTPFEYTKIKCASILFTAPKWYSIIYMLKVLSSNEECTNRLALQAIKTWLTIFNKSFSQATIQQKECIHNLISNIKKQLPADYIKELLFVLK